MNKTIAYLAGLVASDGHLSKDTGIAVYVKNKRFARLVKSFFLRITKQKISVYKSKGALRINVFDAKLFHAFNKKFKIPFGKKSDKIIFPHGVSMMEKTSFVKGYADGDGSIYVDKRRRHGVVNKYLRVEIASQSKLFLEDLKIFLCNFGINCGQVTSGQRTSRIRIYARNAQIFADKIGFFHPDNTLHS